MKFNIKTVKREKQKELSLEDAVKEVEKTGFDVTVFAEDYVNVALKAHHQKLLVNNIKEGVIRVDTTKLKNNEEALVAAHVFVRDMVNKPANLMPSLEMQRVIEEEFKDKKNVKVIVTHISEHDFPLVHAVGMGADRKNPPMVITLHLNPSREDSVPITLIGKGIIFDTGGNDLKPSIHMQHMHTDMAGAAAVAGAIKFLADTGSDKEVVGILCIAKNVLGSRSQNTHDMWTSRKGLTVEITNTDAEGRLVLADGMALAQDTYNTKKIVTIATLTGAVRYAVGDEMFAVFSNTDVKKKFIVDETHVFSLTEASQLKDAYKGKFTDLINSANKHAGHLSAAAFLSYFVNEGVEFVHADIAATAWSDTGNKSTVYGATGSGIEFLIDQVNDKKDGK